MGWRANDGLRADTVFMPYHWALCNRLVADALDLISKIPGFKYTPVSIAAAQPCVGATSASTTASSIGMSRADSGSII